MHTTYARLRHGDWIELQGPKKHARVYYILEKHGDHLVCRNPRGPVSQTYVFPRDRERDILLIGTSRPNPWYPWFKWTNYVHPVKIVRNTGIRQLLIPLARQLSPI